MSLTFKDTLGDVFGEVLLFEGIVGEEVLGDVKQDVIVGTFALPNHQEVDVCCERRREIIVIIGYYCSCFVPLALSIPIIIMILLLRF